AVLIAHVQLPALLTDIGDAECSEVPAGNPDRLDDGERKVLGRQPAWILYNLLERRAHIRTPDPDRDIGLPHVVNGDVEAFVLGYAADVVEIASAGIGAVNNAAAIGHAHDGKVGAHHTILVEEVGVDALADIGVAADPCGTQPLHQRDMVWALDV